MKLLTLVFLGCSHAPLLWNCYRAVRQRQIPKSVDCVGLSLALYFDIEIAFEAFGGEFHHPFAYFKPFFSAGDVPLTIAVIFLICAPWVLKAGYKVSHDLARARTQRPLQELVLAHPKLFYAVAIILGLFTAVVSVRFLLSYASVWSAQADVRNSFGPLTILFYLPMSVLAFYVRQPEARTRGGKFFVLGLVCLSILSAVGLGERTLVLLPILIAAIFSGKPSIKGITVTGALLMSIAVIMVPMSKYAFSNAGPGEAASSVFTGDIARGPVLIHSINDSVVIGSRALPYPGSGYFFNLLLYVPRVIAPFKGWPTSRIMTARITETRPDEIDWGIGLGALDEVILNFGLLAFVPGMFVYGMAFGLTDRLAVKFPVLIVSSRLAAIWLLGYDLTAIIVTFAALGIAGIFVQVVFTKRRQMIEIPVAGYMHKDN